MICNHCNKRIWFWQDKIKRIQPVFSGDDIVMRRAVYYHAQCEPHGLSWYDAKLVNTNKQVFTEGTDVGKTI